MATTTNYGWETPDDTDLVKDGALAQRTTANSIDSTLGTALNNKLHAGLVLVKTQTIGTGVTSVTVTGAFSATYDNYKIVISGGTGSANGGIAVTLGSTSSGYKFNLIYSTYGGGLTNATSGTATSWPYVGAVSTSSIWLNCEINSPFLTEQTVIGSHYVTLNDAGTFGGILNDTNSYTAFTLSASPNTMTGGTIAVYGYAKD